MGWEEPWASSRETWVSLSSAATSVLWERASPLRGLRALVCKQGAPLSSSQWSESGSALGLTLSSCPCTLNFTHFHWREKGWDDSVSKCVLRFLGCPSCSCSEGLGQPCRTSRTCQRRAWGQDKKAGLTLTPALLGAIMTPCCLAFALPCPPHPRGPCQWRRVGQGRERQGRGGV